MDSEKNTAVGRKSLLRRHVKLTLRYVRTFVLWAAAGLVIGALGGLIGTAFCYAIREATQLRGAYPWLLYFLPAGGLLIVWLYRLRGMHPTDTNGVLLAIHAPTSIPGSTAPLIFVGTTITHLFGGSAGREGAALQLGGVLGYQLGRALKLDEKDIHLIVMCGMSSVFSALFGSPLTAAVFAMEVASVGILHFSAILPCLTASLTAAYLASALGAAAETFPLGAAVPFTWASAGTVVAIAAACAVLSIVYCIALRQGGKVLGKAVPNSYLRVFLGGSAVVLLSVLLGTRDYNGAGMDIVTRAIEQETVAVPWAFLLKLVFTAVTLAAGFKGGEVVPSFFVGATFGCAVSPLLGLPVGFGAAVGLAAVFCGVTNCPVASTLLAVELFGAEGMLYFALACCLSYMLSGYQGLYSSQTILYSKLKAQFINVHTNAYHAGEKTE